jgi:hypothetical protein
VTTFRGFRQDEVLGTDQLAGVIEKREIGVSRIWQLIGKV